MAKSLQEQLLAAGLINQKKAKAATRDKKKQDHRQRTGKEEVTDETKERAEQARLEKAQRDRELNRQRDELAQQRAIAAQVRQLIDTNAINSQYGDIKYQFVAADKKVKQLYVDQAIWDRLSRGQLAIIAQGTGYAVVPLAICDKIRQRDEGIFIYIADAKGDVLADDDPYAAYQIPDDLMW